MSELHDLCRFPTRPIDKSYLEKLDYFLSNGIPATYTVEEVELFNAGKEDEEPKTFTTPLHLICSNIPKDINEDETKVICDFIEELFSWGAGWNLTDINDLTAGEILINKGLYDSKFYEIIVDAGVRAEILLRKINGGEIEFLSDEEFPVDDDEIPQLVDPSEEQLQEIEKLQAESELKEKEAIEKFEEIKNELINDPANTQSTYLKTKLEYKNDALITSDNLDGVMMEWERSIMKTASDTIFKSTKEPETPREDLKEINVLNIGFGMGIIDTYIQENEPTHHYISEAHPDVLAKLEQDGWFEKPNVTILKGRWQDTLPDLLNQGVFFNGIYYDTYSEHYDDMLELYDLIVGLLKPSGIFSFFNGLGADRQVVYDVYKKIVELDMNNYGLEVKYANLEIPKQTLKESDQDEDSTWIGIKRAYWRCKTYYHPEIRFI